MMRGKTLFLILVGAVALGVGVWLGQALIRQTVEPPLAIAGIYFPDAQEVVNFTLTDQTGRPFTRQDFKGHWTFLYFGYTYCPDVCPLTLARLNTVDQRLVQQGLDRDIAYIMISVDPRRDTPERLGQYTAFFNKKFQGVTGTPEELDKLVKQCGIYYKLQDQEDKQNYVVDHSSVLVLIDPDARLRAIFTQPDQPDTVVADFGKIRTRYQASR